MNKTNSAKKVKKHDGNPNWIKGVSGGNTHGRPPSHLCFTPILKEQLLKRKRFIRPDGRLMETSELELIALKVVRELRTAIPINVKLLSIVLDRLEGRPTEPIELSGTMEVSSGIDARDVILQRLDRIISAREAEDNNSEPES